MSGLEKGLEFRERMAKQQKLLETQMEGYPSDRASLLRSRLPVFRLTDEEIINECSTLKAQIDNEASDKELDAVMDNL